MPLLGSRRIALVAAGALAVAAVAFAVVRGRGDGAARPTSTVDAGAGADAGSSGSSDAGEYTIDAPNDPNVPDRYEKKPVLLIIENYVLATIGQLSPEKDAATRAYVKRAMGGGDDWRPTVRKAMQWPDTIDKDIREAWTKYARNEVEWGHNATLSPHEFAMKWADKHAPPD